jgi:mannose-6-phosphate isomerase
VIPTSSEKRIQRLAGVVQPYPWGSPTAIPDLLGREPTGRPEAELWFGTHERGPSEVVLADGTSHRLADWIGRDPVTVLGAQEAGRFGSELPFLLKVLAAAAPLSIQAHPNREQARAGFERENAAGIPLDADRRCYRDPDPKPELICALSRFEALNRFREPPDIAVRRAAVSAPGRAPVVVARRRRPDAGGRSGGLTGLLGLPEPSRRDLVSRAAEHAARQSSEPAWGWVESLSARYPTDVGVLAPLLLNFVTLEPGQAMFLPAGELHSYLRGTGIEIMANSDNVLRGGLTDKHVDPGELTRTLTFRSGPVTRTRPRCSSASPRTAVGRSSSSSVSLSSRTRRRTSPAEPRCRNTATRKRLSPGTECAKSASPPRSYASR